MKLTEILTQATVLAPGERIMFRRPTPKDAKTLVMQLHGIRVGDVGRQRRATLKELGKLTPLEAMEGMTSPYEGLSWYVDREDKCLVIVEKLPDFEFERAKVLPDGTVVPVERFAWEIASDAAEEEERARDSQSPEPAPTTAEGRDPNVILPGEAFDDTQWFQDNSQDNSQGQTEGAR